MDLLWMAAAGVCGFLVRDVVPALRHLGRVLRGQDLPTVEELGDIATGKALPCCCDEVGMPSANCGRPGHTPLGRPWEGLVLFRRGQYAVLQVTNPIVPGRIHIACKWVAGLVEGRPGWLGADYCRETFEQARQDVIYLAGKRVPLVGWN